MSDPQSPWWTTGAFSTEQRQAIFDDVGLRQQAFPKLIKTMWTTGELTARMSAIEPKPEPTEEFKAIEQHTVRRRLGDFGEA